MATMRTCIVIHVTGASDLTSKQTMIEVPAWETGVPGLVLTPSLLHDGSVDIASGVQVTHEPTGLTCTRYALSIANARQYAMELSFLGDWTVLREAGLPVAWKPGAAAAWARAQLRDEAEQNVVFADLTSDQLAALDKMEGR